VSELTYVEAIRQALADEMAGDPAVCVLGEDVAVGGAFGATRGLAERFGTNRVKNTPISEGAITGLAIGAALAGMRPVLEIMFIDFITLAMDGIVNQAAKYHYMSGGQLSVPLVVRTQIGAAGGAAAQHSQSLESWFCHVPGLVVLAPSTPDDAYHMLRAAVRLDDPVLFVEHKRLYPAKGTMSASATSPVGKARVVREGTDATVITYSGMVRTALEAAEEVAPDSSLEIIDLRSLVPLDIATLVRSVQKTHRVLVVHEAVQSGGPGAEIAAQLLEAAFEHLDAPIFRVGYPFTPVPFAVNLERFLLPGRQQVVQAVRKLLHWKAQTASESRPWQG
jgi:acetoin:2,6-dichlorophenolindophenol oxidoreductase subunit beta